MGCFYHESAWITGLAEALSYKTHFLTAHQGNELVGGLALAEVPGLLGGHRLVSFPFSFVAGAMTSDAAAETLLAEGARDLASRTGAKRVELKRLGDAHPVGQGFERSTRYTTYQVATAGGEEALWKRLHRTSTQQRIKKGEKAGVQVVEGRSEEDWLAMARLEEEIQRGHGVPAPPRRLFTQLGRRLQEQGLADLYLARIPSGAIVAGYVIGLLGFGKSAGMFQTAAAASAALGLYSFALPHTPPSKKSGAVTMRDILGLDALALMKERSFAIFVLGSFLICIPLQFYYGLAGTFLSEIGVANVESKMTLGQWSEIGFMLVMPFFFARLGVKWMLLIGMFTWALRYVLFAFGDAHALVWMVYLGIIVHGTAGLFDPGWRGKATLELSNLGRMPVALYPGMRICSFTFEQLTTPSSMPYHKKASNKYAGQTRPLASKLVSETAK